VDWFAAVRARDVAGTAAEQVEQLYHGDGAGEPAAGHTADLVLVELPKLRHSTGSLRGPRSASRSVRPVSDAEQMSHALSAATFVLRPLLSWLRFRRKFGHLATTYAVNRKWTGELQPYEMRVSLKGKSCLLVTFQGLPDGDQADAKITMNMETSAGHGSYTHSKSGKWLRGDTTVSVAPDGSILEDRTYVHHVDFTPVAQSFVWTPKPSQ
jgi:hypothetical protein